MQRNFSWSNKLSQDSFQIIDLINSEKFLDVKKEELDISDVDEYVEEDEDCVDDAFEEVDIEGTVYTIEDSAEEEKLVAADESMSPARKKAKGEGFLCNSCDLTFSSEAELQEHSETHDKPGFIPPRQYQGYRRDKYGIYSCDSCYFESPGIMAMKLHRSRKHDNFVDPDEQGSNFSDLWDSNEASRDGLRLSEPDDEDASRDNSNLPEVAGNSRGKNKAAAAAAESGDDYDKMHDGFPRTRTEYRCQYCDFRSISRAAMATHLLKEHSDDWNAAVALRQQEVREFTQGKSEKIMACLYCPFAATSRSTLAAHTRRKHQGFLQAYQVEPKSRQFKAKVDLKCDKCDFVTQCKHKLATHVGRKHTTELNFPCSYCGKRFKMKVDVTAHIKMQHEQTPHICDVCGKVVGSANALHIHQKREHFQPEFQCHLCRRRMVSQENLDDHMVRQHMNAPKYQCEQCGKIFGQPCKLKQHMRTHTGERPHTCHKCGKSFARRSVFRQHMLIHTGQRPYVCDICGKSFTQKPGLICHRKSHPGEKPPLPVVYIDSILTDFVNNDLNDAKQPEEIIEETVNFDDCLMED
ncbi:hypothetical protein TKK_0011480 [Trichogramma kaykai]|uniref:C2H2-type domain-containing protein n=1 Tax=Trichogramma kaykai TaxID=54128 RepID=A0ABD2WSE8_9HYME